MSQEEKCSKGEIGFSVAAVLLTLGIISYGAVSCHNEIAQNRKERIAREEACTKLDAKLGDTVTAKAGPYSDSEMTAIKFGRETLTAVPVDMMLISGVADMQLRFTCDELKIIKRANDKSEK